VTQALDGYEVRVTKVGRAAGDYQLGGITGFVNVGGEDIATSGLSPAVIGLLTSLSWFADRRA